MLRLPDHWVWDSWYARDDSGRWHVFFLRASRALGDPHRRHHRASIGHAVSTDLRNWRLVADALVPADAPAWDDLATWTGSTVRGPDGRWYLFYTGVSRAEQGLVQRIGLAVSDDLMTWHRHGTEPLVEADPTWYELLDRDAWYEQAWRDPWVFPDPAGAGWHMLITARSATGPADTRGVIGHATSDDLTTWRVRPPLSVPAGFGHLEVPQVVVIDGQPLLLFCTNNAVSPARGATTDQIWVVPGTATTGPWDVAAAQPFTHPGLYAPRLVPDADQDGWQLIGFLDHLDGRFVGEIIDPVPVRYTPGVGPPRFRWGGGRRLLAGESPAAGGHHLAVARVRTARPRCSARVAAPRAASPARTGHGADRTRPSAPASVTLPRAGQPSWCKTPQRPLRLRYSRGTQRSSLRQWRRSPGPPGVGRSRARLVGRPEGGYRQ